MVILGPQKEVQIRALESNASCIIVGCGFEVDPEVIQMANKKDCVIITTPYDTFSIARLINQSMPIKEFMTREHLVTFDIDDYVDDVKETMSKIRHRDFPILDENGNYLGMVSRRNLMSMQKKQIILVDHNEKSQAVDNINEAEILEIIDHHRIGSLETISPSISEISRWDVRPRSFTRCSVRKISRSRSILQDCYCQRFCQTR